jgi:acyl carrier protein
VSDEEVRALLLRELRKIAPEAEVDEIEPAADLRQQIDLDSMDILNFMVAIHAATGVDIPEADYPKLATLLDAIGYLRGRLEGAAKPS